jgi:hypothetical protein
MDQEESELVMAPGAPYEPWMSHDDPHEGEYQRSAPANFAGDSDDIFMRSVIMNYAQEGSDCDELDDGSLVNCKPTGVFTLTKSGAKALMSEVLGTHAGLSGDALSSYLDTYFDKAWGHFDVMQTGGIEAQKAGALSRFLLSDQRKQLGESGF